MKSELIFKYGTMASGKSLYLLSTAHQFKINNIKYQLFKSDIDTRDIGAISSRIGISEECVLINKEDYFEKYINSDTKWILIDEAQFLTSQQIDELAYIVDNKNINVICYGLRTDFKTQLFPGSKRLFEIADSFEEIKSSCYCNSKTIFNARIDGDENIVTEGEQIEIGGDDRYTSMCRKCYFEKTNHPLYKQNKNNLD